MPDCFKRSARSALSTGLMLVLMCLAVAAQAAKSDSRNGFFWHPEIAPTGPVVVVVSLDEQHRPVSHHRQALPQVEAQARGDAGRR